jgi:hypothetical protein
MFKRIFFVLITAILVVGSAVTPQTANAGGSLPACSDVSGGNVNFLVCKGFAIDHFWSGTKINVLKITNNYAVISSERINQGKQIKLMKGVSKKLNLSDTAMRRLTLTYLGKGQEGRAIIKVSSNFTYQDSFNKPFPTPIPTPIPPQPPQSLELKLTTDKNAYHTDENVYVTAKANQIVAWIQIIDLYKMTAIKDCFNTDTCTVEKTDGYHQYDGLNEQVTITGFSAIANLYCADVSQGNTCGGYYTTDQINIDIIPQPVLALPAPSIFVSAGPYYMNGKRYIDISWNKIDSAYAYYGYMEYVKENNSSYGWTLYDNNVQIKGEKWTVEVGADGEYHGQVIAYKNQGDWLGINYSNPSWSNYFYISVGPDQFNEIQARDSKRLSDLKQIQTALELYYVDHNHYPIIGGVALGKDNFVCLGIDGWGTNGCNNQYMGYVPADPNENQAYIYTGEPNNYIITAQLEGTIEGLSGTIFVTPSGIVQNL